MPSPMTTEEALALIAELRVGVEMDKHCRPDGDRMLKALDHLASLAADAEALQQQIRDEISANLAFRAAGGARPDEDMPTFCARISSDAKRLDWLEHMARNGGMFLYTGVDVEREKRTAVGLGLRPGRVDRNLREAIDLARGKG